MAGGRQKRNAKLRISSLHLLLLVLLQILPQHQNQKEQKIAQKMDSMQVTPYMRNNWTLLCFLQVVHH